MHGNKYVLQYHINSVRVQQTYCKSQLSSRLFIRSAAVVTLEAMHIIYHVFPRGNRGNISTGDTFHLIGGIYLEKKEGRKMDRGEDKREGGKKSERGRERKG